MTSSTQNYRDTTPTSFTEKATNLYNKVQPIVQATGSILSLASNTAGIASLGYKALKSPFDLFEHGQRISASNAVASLNKLNSSFANNPMDFTEGQFNTAKQNISTVEGFTKNYGQQGILRPNITTPEEINGLNAITESHKSGFGDNFAETRDRLIKSKTENDLRNAQNPDLSEYNPEDRDIISGLESVGSTKKSASYYLRNASPAMRAEDNRRIQDIKNSAEVYMMYRDKNDPESIAKCRTAVSKINKLAKELIFPQDQRQAILNLKYDYALRSKKWRT